MPRTNRQIPLLAARIGTLVQSARLSARLRLRGAKSGLVTCEGRLPRLHTGGHLDLERVALRCATAKVELGALPGGTLQIRSGVFINQGATVVASQSIFIGEGARIGDYVAVYDTDHHAVDEGRPVRTAPVRIERNAWLARGAVVLPGVTVGRHSVVAANSVVREDVPPCTLVAGNPAREVRAVSAGENWMRA